MLNVAGFDRWADEYEQSVRGSEAADSYPFAGYSRVLRAVCANLPKVDRPVVLDLGFGTGALTAQLYERGCEVWGQDFSPRMLELARERMPEAHLFCGDFARSLCAELLDQRYDAVVSTYALHHLTDEQKVPLLRTLQGLLRPGGKILIGDVAFPDGAALDRCRRESGDEWDDEEHYFVYEDLRRALPELTFAQLSPCAGLLTLAGKEET